MKNVSCGAWYIRHVRWTCLFYISFIIQYIGEMETRFIKETEMVFGNFEGKDARSGSFTVEPF